MAIVTCGNCGGTKFLVSTQPSGAFGLSCVASITGCSRTCAARSMAAAVADMQRPPDAVPVVAAAPSGPPWLEDSDLET